MSSRHAVFAGLAALILAGAALAQDSTQFLTKDPAFKPIFNGKDLSGWAQVNCAPETFTVKDGEIVCTGIPNGVLRSEKPYANFVLELEWRHMKADSNSGLFIWSDPLPIRGSCFTRSVEVQIMDGRQGDNFTSDGDMFAIQGAHMMPQTGKLKGQQDRYALPEGKYMNPSPQWNHYRVTSQDGAVTLAVNGHEVTRGDHATPAAGYLCLESEGSEIHFRNIKIKEMPGEVKSPAPDPVNGPSGVGQGEGFVPLYNGLNFQGWKYGKDQEGHFKADNWTISYDGGGEDLWTEKSYKDFVLICDWKWTAKPKEVEHPVVNPDGTYKLGPDGKQVMEKVQDAGDSGIYLRGSSKSQVNMWCWPIGSGEVYGYRTDPKMPKEVVAGVTPKMNADAPIGQWNRFVITMKGDELTVVLNGKTVLEKAKLPGVAAEGPIALQHHGDPCQFANIYIKELK
jgi:3-keto-disaccharide hydrolase